MSAFLGMVQVTVANTALDGTGTLADVVTGPDNGCLVTRIEVKGAQDFAAAEAVRIFVYDGTNTRLYGEIMMAITTHSTTTATASGAITAAVSIPLRKGDKVKASTNNGYTSNVFAFGSNN